MPVALDPAAEYGTGCVDFLTYSPQIRSWIACGWVGLTWEDSDERSKCLLMFDNAEQTAEAVICLFPRADVKKFGFGFVMFIEAPRGRNELMGLVLHGPRASFRLGISSGTERISEADAINRVRAELGRAPRSDRRARLLKLLSRSAFAGHDTLDALPQPVFLEVDVAYLCPPDGIFLKGWFADPFRQAAAVRLRCGGRSELVERDHWIEISRPDVVAALLKTTGFSNERCGFATFVPNIYAPGETCYFEVETWEGEIGFKKLQPPRAGGTPAIKNILAEFDLRYEALSHGFDHVIGPAVAALDVGRLGSPPNVTELVFGEPPDSVRCSIIVPLYGRIDFMEYQLAFFERTLASDVELIYVLDDPTLIRAVGGLASSCLARFRRPFRVLTYKTNLGYAPANNIGLRFARGEYVCFLNSDIFPKEPRWLEFMLATAAADPAIGVLGALLLFEDESVQHEGMSFEHLPEFGNWIFCNHPRKGLAPREGETVSRVPAVTGACMLLRTELARALGGFDEGYVIGDFEDADLCLKAAARGLACAVDHRAQLYHLERQSQGGYQGSWRQNLTLYNAWRFQQLWRPTLEAIVRQGVAR